MRHMRRIKTRRGGVKRAPNRDFASQPEKRQQLTPQGAVIRDFANDYITRNKLTLGQDEITNLDLVIKTPGSLSACIQYYNDEYNKARDSHSEMHQSALNAGGEGWGTFYYEHQDFLNLLTAIHNHLYSAPQTATQQHPHGYTNVDPELMDYGI